MYRRKVCYVKKTHSEVVYLDNYWNRREKNEKYKEEMEYKAMKISSNMTKRLRISSYYYNNIMIMSPAFKRLSHFRVHIKQSYLIKLSGKKRMQ
jgi:hypothetical protein